MAPGRRGRGSLTQGLDREVHQVVRKIIDERTEFGDFRPTFAAIYDEIRRSNSSLNRKPKKLLEDSIERVLVVIRQDAESDSEADIEPETSPRASNPRALPTSNGMNRSIVAAWSSSHGTANGTGTGTSTPTQIVEEATIKPAQTNGEPPKKKRKRAPEISTSPPTHVSLWDLGGVDDVVQEFSELLTVPLLCPSISPVQAVRGILIHGPPGCGKTTIANAIAASYNVNFISISAPSIISGMSGESEKALRECFESAKAAAPCLLFMDEIDAITPKRESASREMEKRIVAQLATLMDSLDPEQNDGKCVIVLAATNRPDALDPALRRGGRFDKEINMNVPNEDMREQILEALTYKLTLSDDVDLKAIAVRTPGYVGADLKDLVSTAANTAVRRFQDSLALEAAATAATEARTILDHPNDMDIDMSSAPASQLSQHISAARKPKVAKHFATVLYLTTHPQPPTPITITHADLLTSLPKVSPSALREGFATVPSTTFSSIGGLSPTITTLSESLIAPIKRPDLFAKLGIRPASGTLLFGPPGCGKTLLARAIANASHANFISVKGPELLNKYVGESERAVRNVFQRARSSVPVIIFFDELDALVPSRKDGTSEASARVVNTMLTELDGVGADRSGIYVVAATNRPDLVDGAMLRPGRLDSLIYIPLPDKAGRVDILKALTREMPIMWSTRLQQVAETAEGFSGADLAGLKTKAGQLAIRRITRGLLAPLIDGPVGVSENGHSGLSGTPAGPGAVDQIDVGEGVTVEDFEEAVKETRRSVSAADMRDYERLRKKWEEGLPQGS
jgi:ribosome biogenesis ATPase